MKIQKVGLKAKRPQSSKGTNVPRKEEEEEEEEEETLMTLPMT